MLRLCVFLEVPSDSMPLCAAIVLLCDSLADGQETRDIDAVHTCLSTKSQWGIQRRVHFRRVAPIWY